MRYVFAYFLLNQLLLVSVTAQGGELKSSFHPYPASNDSVENSLTLSYDSSQPHFGQITTAANDLQDENAFPPPLADSYPSPSSHEQASQPDLDESNSSLSTGLEEEEALVDESSLSQVQVLGEEASGLGEESELGEEPSGLGEESELTAAAGFEGKSWPLVVVVEDAESSDDSEHGEDFSDEQYGENEPTSSSRDIEGEAGPEELDLQQGEENAESVYAEEDTSDMLNFSTNDEWTFSHNDAVSDEPKGEDMNYKMDRQDDLSESNDYLYDDDKPEPEEEQGPLADEESFNDQEYEDQAFDFAEQDYELNDDLNEHPNDRLDQNLADDYPYHSEYSIDEWEQGEAATNNNEELAFDHNENPSDNASW